ncbi:MAG: sugar transferase [Flavobacteriia bacterium]|nr:sugar transferase [Flavobacteriia bacterium]
MYLNVVKRTFDFCLALVLLLLLSPVLAFTALLLMYYNGGTPFFLQQRPGRNGRPFRIIKYKTMKDLYDSNGEPLPDEARITPIGKKVRSWSLDELLQIINVLKGDMSFVGPRPLLMEYLPLYNSRQQLRHTVKPGITGWAQVNGRNTLSWEDKFELDVVYTEKVGFFLDMRIIARTIIQVLKRQGISEDGGVSMTKFKGSK